MCFFVTVPANFSLSLTIEMVSKLFISLSKPLFIFYFKCMIFICLHCGTV